MAVSSRPGALALGLAGVVALGLAVAALHAIPRGISEFVYFPSGGGQSWIWPLPFAPMTGFTPEQLSSHVARLLLLTPACVLLGLALAAWIGERKLPLPPVRMSVLACVILVTLAATVVIRGVPLQDDEPTYLMQAELLAHGRLTGDVLPAEARFAEAFTIFPPGRGMTGKYLFGQPLVLLPGFLLGVPVLGNVALAALALVLVASATARSAPGPLAAIATALLALSPQLVFTSATLLGQAATLFGIALAVWAVGRGGFVAGLWAGLGLGLTLAVRPQVAVPCGLALLAVYYWRDRRLLCGLALASLPWLLAVLAYDAAVTGDPLRLPWSLYAPEPWGFVPGLHTPWKGVLVTLVVLVRLNAWSLGWPLSLVGPVLWLALRCPHRRAVMPWAWVATATFLFQFGYYSPGTSDTGAIYHHTVLPFIALSTASAALTLATTPERRRRVAGVVLAACVLGTGSFYVEHALRLRRLTAKIEGPDRSRLGMRLPALLLEATNPAVRPLVGWVTTVPYRPRDPSQPLVIYPSRTVPQMRWLIQRYRRDCYFLTYDFVASPSWALRACLSPEKVVSGAEFERRWPPSRDRGTPWREAFRWLPGLEASPASGASVGTRGDEAVAVPTSRP